MIKGISLIIFLLFPFVPIATAQDLDICDNCQATTLTVGLNGDFQNLRDALCSYYPGDVVVVSSNIILDDTFIIDGDDEEYCYGYSLPDGPIMISSQRISVSGTRVSIASQGQTPTISLQADIHKPVIRIQNADVTFFGIRVEADSVGMSIEQNGVVHFYESIFESTSEDSAALLEIRGGSEVHVGTEDGTWLGYPLQRGYQFPGLRFIGTTVSAIDIQEGDLFLQYSQFGTALESSPLRSQFNIRASNALIRFQSKFINSTQLNDFGGFSVAAIWAEDSRIDGWRVQTDVPNEHFDDRNGDSIPRGPRPQFGFHFTNVEILKSRFEMSSYAPYYFDGVSGNEIEVDASYCSKEWGTYQRFFDFNQLNITLLEISYDKDSICHEGVRQPYYIDDPTTVGEIRCGYIYTSTQVGCEDNVWGRYGRYSP